MAASLLLQGFASFFPILLKKHYRKIKETCKRLFWRSYVHSSEVRETNRTVGSQSSIVDRSICFWNQALFYLGVSGDVTIIDHIRVSGYYFSSYPYNNTSTNNYLIISMVNGTVRVTFKCVY